MNYSVLVLALVASLAFTSDAFARGGGGRGANGGSHSVRGHVTKNGTYISPHYRTNPNSTRGDNWSTTGNVNPYTGKQGTKQ
jgi:hypothetical protein